MQFCINSLYLCVLDMGRAIAFYEEFFQQPPARRDDVYSIFDIGGFHLGLFAFQKVGETHVFGSNCLPSVRVESLSALRQKLEGLPIVFALQQIGTNWVAEFRDSEGNHIELTAPVAPGDTLG